MFRGALHRARDLQRRTVRGRVHVAIRMDPTREHSHNLGEYSAIDRAQGAIESLESIAGWIHLPTNPFWVSDPARTGGFWEILDLDVDRSQSDPKREITIRSPTFETDAWQ